MNKHIMSDLYQMQSLPLSIKIRMTQNRIREWVEYYGAEYGEERLRKSSIKKRKTGMQNVFRFSSFYLRAMDVL